MAAPDGRRAGHVLWRLVEFVEGCPANRDDGARPRRIAGQERLEVFMTSASSTAPSTPGIVAFGIAHHRWIEFA
jgi:hypothetical protein